MKIYASDDKVFYVSRQVCMISKHLKNALTSGMKEGQENSEYGDEQEQDNVPQPEDGIKLKLSSEILETCLNFMHYKHINREVSFARPEFQIEPDMALKVLEAAIYLQV